MKTRKLSFLIGLLTAVVLLPGCVGTIKDANSLSTRSSSVPANSISEFRGVESVVAIADTKVDVFFPAVSGDTDKFAYVIRYSSQQIPVYIQANILKPVIHVTETGERVSSLKTTISGLRSDTNYEFSVDVRDITTGSESANNVYKAVKTFTNQTAIFSGINDVQNLSGAAGLNGIEVFWTEAEVRGTTTSKNDIDPVSYEIVVLNGSTPGLAKSPSEMNDKTLPDTSRTTYTVPAGNRSFVINGLRSFTKYYVQVRALHYGKTVNMTNSAYKAEENTNYIEIVTYSPTKAPTITNKDSFASSYPPGPQGLTSINLSWQKALGVFDHYRIYYNIGDFNPAITASCTINCEIINSSKNLHTVIGVTARKNYYLALVICTDVACTNSISYTKISHLTAPPAITSYSGVLSIDTAKNLSTLDKLYLNVGVPDFNLGYIAGVDIYGCQSTTTTNCTPNNVSNLLTTSTMLSIDPGFDYSIDNVITISGVDPASPYSYCFYARPFVFNDLNVKTYVESPLSSAKCRIPEIKAPAFSGFVADASCDILKWQTPTTGVFDGFEIYYKLKSSFYEVSVPLTLTSGVYERIIVNPNITELSTSQLPLVTGGAYDFGVRTIYRSASGDAFWLRSSNTTVDKLLKCLMP